MSSTPGLRILYLTEEVPNQDPVHGNGSSMISYGVLTHLPPDAQVSLLTFAGAVAVPDEVRARCSDVTVLPIRRPRAGVVAMAVSSRSWAAQHRSTRRIRATVRTLSAAADVTLIHGPHAAILAKDVIGPLAVQVIDPLSLVHAAELPHLTGWRWVYRLIKGAQARALERTLPNRAVLLTVSSGDAAAWSSMLGRRVEAVPNGVDLPVHGRRSRSHPTVAFVGSLGYEPNIESVEVLVREIAPKVLARVPDTRFVIVGRQPDERVLSLAGDHVEVLANVPSILDVLESATVAAFPDRRGLGIRNSVTEAMAARLPVIATSIAAREQPASPLLRVVDDVEAFADAIVEELTGPSAPAGEDAVALRSWTVAAQEYLTRCRQAVDTPSGGPSGRRIRLRP